MAANIRNTNLRFNLEKDLQRKAWEYLQTMDKQEFRILQSGDRPCPGRSILTAITAHRKTPIWKQEREERFVDQILKTVEKSLEQFLPLFLSGLTAGLAPRSPKIRPPCRFPKNRSQMQR